MEVNGAFGLEWEGTEAPDVEQVRQAIRALHHTPHPHDKEKASAWLGRLQKSIHSWKLSDELLLQKYDLESCYFAAQTMRSKIQNSFYELPPESHVSLRDSLLEHISVITRTTSTAIITQLCVALADLALQMTGWTDPVENLIDKFAADNVWVLLEILTVIPEEVSSSSIRLGENRREELKHYLQFKSVIINEFLKQTLATAGQNEQVSIKIIKCLTSWVSLKAINVNSVAENVVLSHAFQVLSYHDSCSSLHDVATDCVCALLQCLEDNQNEEIDRYVYCNVTSLEMCYHVAVAHEDQEKAMNYSRIFTELGESFLIKIINYNEVHFAMEALHLVLICVGHHDYEVAEISFNLWYRLSEELYNKNNDNLTNGFKPYIERLINALCRHCQMEPDHRGLLNKDDEFYDFRQKVCELTKDVVFIIGSSHCFKEFFLSIQGQDVSWERTEAALFIMQAVAKNMLPNEYEYVPKVVEAILNMPDSAHTAVKHTSIILLGELCEWIEKHPECLKATSDYLFKTLQDPALASVSAHSLQSICSTCRAHMRDQLSELLQIVRNLDSFGLSTSAAIDFLRGVAAIIGFLPYTEVTAAMLDVCAVQITPLAALNNNLPMVNVTSTDPILWLDRLSALFRYCKLTVPEGQLHPCLPVLSGLWPVFSNTMEKYSSDVRIMERLCRCLRFAIRFLGKQGNALFDPLAKKMVIIYLTHRHSCFLYLASILVDEFAEDENCIEGLMKMLQTLIIPTFDLLQNTGLKQHPDTVDDLFRLCDRFLQKVPLHFIQSSVIDSIIQCGMLACSLDHRDANSSVMKFFSNLVHMGRTSQKELQKCVALFSAKISQHGEALVNNLVHASVFCLHAYMLHDVANVLYEMLKWNRVTVVTWLENGLNLLSQRSTSATPAQLLQFHKTVTEADREANIVDALRDFAKLYH